MPVSRTRGSYFSSLNTVQVSTLPLENYQILDDFFYPLISIQVVKHGGIDAQGLRLVFKVNFSKF